MDRKSVVFKTSIINTFSVCATVLIGFIKRKVLLMSLGTDILAINSILGDLLALLSLTEFGFQTSIVYRLYKPIHDKDYSAINSLINMLKIIYAVIGISIIVLGIVLSPFLKYIIKDVGYSNIQVITFFLLYILTNSSTYFLAYKRVFLVANQESYKANFISTSTSIVFNIINIYFLYVFKNFYLFLTINLINNLLINIIINCYFDKHYHWYNNNAKIRTEDKKNIIKDTKNVFASRISNFIFNSTDSILISTIINTQLVAYYANYNSIFVSIHSFVANAVSSMSNMFGKILQEDNNEKINKILNNYTFVRFSLSHIILSTTMVLSTAFVSGFYGKTYVLEDKYVYLLGICNYFLIIFTPINELINAAGMFKLEKYIQFFSAVTNIVISIILAKLVGLSGIIFGTIIGCLIGFILRCYFVYKYIIHSVHKLLIIYFIKNIIYFAYLFTFTFIMNIVTKYFVINSLISFCVFGFIGCLLAAVSLFVFYRTDEFKYAIYLLTSFKEKVFNKIK